VEFVCDCSVALAWGLPDEGSEQAEKILQSLHQESTIWVPALWWYELTNTLNTVRHRGRLTRVDCAELLDLFSELPIVTDNELDSNRVHQILSVAIENKLSGYDAAYLELAMRKKLQLATLDQRLVESATKMGVAVRQLTG
jgi:predicted nucleic acid-binding protein